MAKKEPKPKILRVHRADKFVEITTSAARSTESQAVNDKDNPGEKKTNVVSSAREFYEKAPEAPLPAFDEALQALGTVAAKQLGIDPSWAKDGMEVTAISVSYTEHGIRSVQISFAKTLLAGTAVHPLKTPMFQIDDGKTPDQGRRQCAPKHAELVVEFLKEAQRYAAGERSQTLLDFEEEEDLEESKVEQLPGLAARGEVEAE